jgi:hypothetical protein
MWLINKTQTRLQILPSAFLSSAMTPDMDVQPRHLIDIFRKSEILGFSLFRT